MRMRMSAIVLATSLLWPALSPAQGTTGTLTGRLTDTQGLPVPGATVVVSGPQGSRPFVTDTEGRFQAPFLPPGTSSLRAELQGFKAVEVSNIAVSLGQTTDIGVKMEVGGVAEVIEVTGSAAVIDLTSTTTGAVLSDELLHRVPVGRRFSDALYLAPGVSSAGSVGRANPSLSGSSGLDNLYVIDGVNVTNAGYGALGSYSIIFGSLGNGTPFDFMQEVQVKTGGYEAEYGQATGGVVNVVTKSGTNQLRGSVFGYAQPKPLEAEWKTFQSLNGTVNTVDNARSDVGIEGGFPVLRDKVFFFGAVNPSWDTRTFIAPDGFPLVALGEVDRERRTLSYSAKGTFQLSPSHRLDASFFGDPSHGPAGPQRATAMESELLSDGNVSAFSELDRFGGHNQTVRYDGVVSPTWLLEGSYARAYNVTEEFPAVDIWRVIDRTSVPNREIGGIGFYEGNKGENQQWTVKSTHFLGAHQIKAGLSYEDIDYTQANTRSGPTFTAPDGRQTATGAEVTILSDVNFGRIYRVGRANFQTESVTSQKYWSFFVQDSWKVGDRLTINPGLRYEDEALKGGLEELNTLDGQVLDEFRLKNNWAPRIGVVYDLLGNGRSRLYGNWGRFFARVPNDIAARVLSLNEGISRADYFDANLTQPIPNGVATQVPGGSPVTNHFIRSGGADLIDADAKLSYKDEFVVGYEWEAIPDASVGIRYIHRNIGRVLEDISPFPAVACDFGFDAACVTDYVITNPNAETPVEPVPGLEGVTFEDPKHDYDAVELTFDKRFSNNWSLMASYRLSRLSGNFEGFFREDNGQSDPGITSLYDFPTNDPTYTAIGGPLGYLGDIRYLGSLGEGRLPLDRPHAFKMFGSYLFGNGLSVGAGLVMNSGKPLTALASLPPYNNDSEIPLTPRGEGFETIDGFKTRTPFEYQLDLRASYALNFGGRQLTLMADAFNVFNLRRTLDYNAAVETQFESENPDFGTPTSQNVTGQQFQTPFSLRIGARFAF
jgi:hypothetical protein